MNQKRDLKAIASYVTFYDDGLEVIPINDVLNIYNSDSFYRSEVLENVWYMFIRSPSNDAVKEDIRMLYSHDCGEFGFPADILQNTKGQNIFLERYTDPVLQISYWHIIDNTIQKLQNAKQKMEENWQVREL